MPNVTLYVKDADLELVTKAKEELGDSLSSVFVACVRERLERKAASSNVMEKITLELCNEDGDPVVHKSFTGRWLVGGPEQGLRADDETQNWDAGAEWSVAQTKKGAIVVYLPDDRKPFMNIYGSFEEFSEAENSAGKEHPENVIAEVAAALGEPYEIELDI